MARSNPCIYLSMCALAFFFSFFFLPHYSPRDVWDICTFPPPHFNIAHLHSGRVVVACVSLSTPENSNRTQRAHTQTHTHTLGPLFIMSGFNELEAAFSLGGLVFQTDSLVVESVPNFQRLLLLLHRLLGEIEKSKKEKTKENK